jgi:seryl-tRNA synthetase
MLDIRYMREHREDLLAAMAALNAGDAPVERALALDERRRQILARVEVLRAERNSGSKQIGQLMREGKRAEGQDLQARMSAVGEEIKTLDEELMQVETELQDAMLRIPNLPHPSVPVGKDETENVVVRTEGTPRTFEFEPLPHWDLGTQLDISISTAGSS